MPGPGAHGGGRKATFTNLGHSLRAEGETPVRMRRAIQNSREPRVAGRPAPGVGRDLQDDLGARLRAAYDTILQEPLPASLLVLIDKLEAASRRRRLKLVGKPRARAKA